MKSMSVICMPTPSSGDRRVDAAPASGSSATAAARARPSVRGRAGRAEAEDLQRVTDVGEAVGERHLVRPVLDGRALDLDRAPALAADQVVVMAAGAAAVGGLTVVG